MEEVKLWTRVLLGEAGEVLEMSPIEGRSVENVIDGLLAKLEEETEKASSEDSMERDETEKVLRRIREDRKRNLERRDVEKGDVESARVLCVEEEKIRVDDKEMQIRSTKREMVKNAYRTLLSGEGDDRDVLRYAPEIVRELVRELNEEANERGVLWRKGEKTEERRLRVRLTNKYPELERGEVCVILTMMTMKGSEYPYGKEAAVRNLTAVEAYTSVLSGRVGKKEERMVEMWRDEGVYPVFATIHIPEQRVDQIEGKIDQIEGEIKGIARKDISERVEEMMRRELDRLYVEVGAKEGERYTPFTPERVPAVRRRKTVRVPSPAEGRMRDVLSPRAIREAALLVEVANTDDDWV